LPRGSFLFEGWGVLFFPCSCFRCLLLFFSSPFSLQTAFSLRGGPFSPVSFLPWFSFPPNRHLGKSSSTLPRREPSSFCGQPGFPSRLLSLCPLKACSSADGFWRVSKLIVRASNLRPDGVVAVSLLVPLEIRNTNIMWLRFGA